jgi:hypothetical protein
MNKRINVIQNDSQTIENFENVNISKIDSIFNYSCEILICQYFSIFDESICNQALEILLDKIRPKGQIVLGIMNLYDICSDFVNKKISNEVFFTNIKNIHNHIGVEDIISYISSFPENFILTNISKNNYHHHITIVRIK